mmetsp:Transcript_63417/g.112718  ORF Transcript_63417/g.112718 Transcript_63417/m.112718 type:complete len:338 (+) Transcript_63417:56-1069(+)
MPGASLKKITLPDFLSAFREGCRDCGASDELLDALGHAAYELPLPSEWEEAEQQDLVYFWNRASERSSWEHPQMESYVSIVKLASKALEAQLSLRDVLACIASHLRQAEQEAKDKLKVWSSHNSESGSMYFHNEASKETSWENPSEAAQQDLCARNYLLTRFLEHYYGRLADAGPRGHREPGLLVGELPLEVRDYASWIQASLAAHAPKPTANCSLRPQPRRPPLPPFTALPLSRPGSARQRKNSCQEAHPTGFPRPLVLPPRLTAPRPKETMEKSTSLPSLAKFPIGCAPLALAMESSNRRGIDSASTKTSMSLRKPRGIAYGEVPCLGRAAWGGA